MSNVIKKADVDKDMGLRKIQVVRFHDNLMLGKSLDLKSSLAWGDSVLGTPVELYFYDQTFMMVKYCGKSVDQKYSQLIPFAQVATLIFE